MTDEELTELRVRANSADIYGPRESAWLARAALRLLAEVERLRTENAALREIAQAVASCPNAAIPAWGDSGPLYCPFDCIDPDNENWNGQEHAPDCPVTRARALLTPQ